jgi:nucleoside-diphosphate-sugar epimerase
MRALVTGTTGLVGYETAQLLAAEGLEVVGVSRGGARGADVPWPTVTWDMALADPPPELRGRWDVVVHCAADTRWTQPPDDAWRANVDTVVALRPLVADATHVVHVSTAYAVGLRGSPESAELADYRNSYEWSKAGAERAARELFERLTIVRPPLVVGRRGDGRAVRFAGMYTVLRGMASSVVPAIVAVPDAYFDVVPVDDLAALLSAAVAGEGQGDVLTLAGGTEAPSVGRALELMTEALNDWREERALDALDPPRIVSPDSWTRFFLPFAREHLSARHMRILDLLENFQPYLAVAEPLCPTHVVEDVEDVIADAVRFWADANERLASQSPRPWRATA